MNSNNSNNAGHYQGNNYNAYAPPAVTAVNSYQSNYPSRPPAQQQPSQQQLQHAPPQQQLQPYAPTQQQPQQQPQQPYSQGYFPPGYPPAPYGAPYYPTSAPTATGPYGYASYEPTYEPVDPSRQYAAAAPPFAPAYAAAPPQVQPQQQQPPYPYPTQPPYYGAAAGYPVPYPFYGNAAMPPTAPPSHRRSPPPVLPPTDDPRQAPKIRRLEPPSRTLFVRNIDRQVREEDVRPVFEECGRLGSFFDHIRERGMVFMTFWDIRGAVRAYDTVHGRMIGARELDVHFSVPRNPDRTVPCAPDRFHGCLRIISNLFEDAGQWAAMLSRFGELAVVERDSHAPPHSSVWLALYYDHAHATEGWKALRRDDRIRRVEYAWDYDIKGEIPLPGRRLGQFVEAAKPPPPKRHDERRSRDARSRSPMSRRKSASPMPRQRRLGSAQASVSDPSEYVPPPLSHAAVEDSEDARLAKAREAQMLLAQLSGNNSSKTNHVSEAVVPDPAQVPSAVNELLQMLAQVQDPTGSRE